MNENYKTLDQFLGNHKCQKSTGQEHTHTSIGSQDLNIYGGSYTIPEKDKCKFYQLYNKHVFIHNKKAYLTEKHNSHAPILIDLDFRFNSEIIDRQYDENVIISFLKLYVNELVKYIDIDKSKIMAFVLEKSVPVQIQKDNKGYTKDGIHIIFPHIITCPKIQYVLRYKMLNNSKCKQLFQNINITNPIEDIFDVAVIERNNWQMYGSTKPGCEPYKLSKVLTLMEISNEFKLTSLETFSNQDLIKLLSIQQYNDNDIVTPISHMEVEFNNLYDKLPAKHRKRKTRTLNVKNKKSPKVKMQTDENTIKLVKELVNILSVERADDHNKWMQVGWCLHNIDYDLLSTWISFSSKSNKSKIEGTDHGRSEERCKHLWNIMNNEGLSVGSLYLWAKEDNPEKWKEIKSRNLRTYLMKSLNMTHHDIAMVIYQKFKYEFVCSSSKKKIWYQFKNHKWVQLDDNVELKRKISTDIVNEYLHLASYIAK